MNRAVLHIDVNSAYLSWTAVEMKKNGEAGDIRLVPAAIAGDPGTRRGIILAKSEPAKKCGIRTAMTVAEAFRLCPDLKVFPPRHELYAAYSERLFELLSEYTDVIERFSIDECWLDYTGSEKLFGPPREAATDISRRIKEQLGYTVNIGVSENKLLSKMASEMRKPDRIHTLYRHEIEEKMWPLPTGELFGVGNAAADTLAKIGLVTIGDIAGTDISVLKSILKPAVGQMVYERANGIDDSPVLTSEENERKGIGKSVTTPRDVGSEEEASRILLSLSEQVGFSLRDSGKRAGVVSVQLKNTVFKTYRHQKKLPGPISSTSDIYAIARALFYEMWRGENLRLLGVSLSDLRDMDENEQLTLFDEPKNNALEETQDYIRERFGKGAITRGTLL